MRNGLIRLSRPALGRAALCVAACFGAATTAAAPTLPKVVAGKATFDQQGNVFSITNTPGTIINWQSFSVNAGEITRFIQQSSDSAVLNRIVGQDPSRILGALQSNGKVFLINPNGVVFGRDARVDVNGLVASTLNLSDADFLAGKKNFTAGADGKPAGAVRNEGRIATPQGGTVFLVAPNVENSGVITAPNGDVVLAAGRSVQLVDAGNPDLSVVVSAPLDGAINLGQVVAQGGRIGIYGALVNQRGVVNANSAVLGKDGKIILKASRDTLLEQGSVTSATGAGKGGDIQLLGQRVGLTGNAAVDASGALGGGTVLVGGDYQGKNARLPNAQQTWFGQDASIRADAFVAGDGGKVVLWSDNMTAAYGSISARGAGNGNGGLVETSGHDLDIKGIRVDAGATSTSGGRSGTWLLDPYDIVVASDGTAAASDVNAFSKPPGSGVTRVSPATLAATNADIVLQAQHDLTIENDLAAPRSVRAEAKNNIAVNARVTAGVDGDIDLRAGNQLTLGTAGRLASANYIDLKAERMTLAGGIDGVNGILPTVSFSPFNNATAISVGGLDAGGVLVLDPARLAAFNAFEINIGNSAHTGTVSINDPLNLAGTLAIDTNGSIRVNAPVRLSGAGSQFVGTQHPNTAGSSTIELSANLEAAGRVTLRSGQAVYQSGSAAIKTPELLVEAGSVNLNGANEVGTLAGSAGGSEGAGFRFNWLGGLHVGSVGGVSGLTASNDATLEGGALIIDNTIDARVALVDAQSIRGAGTLKATVLSLESSGGIGSATGALHTSADTIMNATNTVNGAASSTAPINIVNDRPLVLGNVVQAGSNNGGAIAIESNGALTVQGTVSTGSGNINLLANNGGLLSIVSGGQVASSSGNVSITAGSTAIAPGSVRVASPDKLSVISSNTPNQPADPQAPSVDTCVANPGATGCARVLETATQSCLAEPGAPGCNAVLQVAAQTCTANPNGAQCAQVREREAILQCIANPDGAGCGATLPSIEVCTKAPATFGCAPVIAREPVKQCIANPDAPGCAATLPAYEACVKAPTTFGCAPVIAREPVKQCIANPDAPGCAATLPAYEVCVKAPTTFGCATVVQREPVKQCIANPDAPGCAATLPAYEVCVKAPTTFGCATVVQREPVKQCIADPKAPGCSTTLPPYAVCSAAPTTFGCAPVIEQHNAVQACIASPTAPGCGEVLPPLLACRLDAGLFGCAPVLARAEFVACLANPTGAGCAARLPALQVCKLTPGVEGCAQVLQLTFDACLVNPGNPSCAGILPTLSQCVADKGRAGCDAVLPTLAQCIGSPTLQGCSVRLPKLEQCAVNPNQAGCEAVLPQPTFCATHPADPVCAVFSGAPAAGESEQSSKPVAVAQQSAVNLINTRTPAPQGKLPAGPAAGTPDGGAGGSGNSSNSSAPSEQSENAGPVAGPKPGAKNEKPATKLYCN